MPTDARQLKERIAQYGVQARELDAERVGLVAQIKVAMVLEVPAINAVLPQNYTVSADEVYIRSESVPCNSDQIPWNFFVDFRLRHKGQIMEDVDDSLVSIQNNPIFREIEDRYGINSVYPMTEPGHM